MDPQVVSPGDGAIDEQILGLLQHHRRLTFLTLAESLPLYTWQALFAALNRLRHPSSHPCPSVLSVVNSFARCPMPSAASLRKSAESADRSQDTRVAY